MDCWKIGRSMMGTYALIKELDRRQRLTAQLLLEQTELVGSLLERIDELEAKVRKYDGHFDPDLAGRVERLEAAANRR